jgi:D-glycero-alpha-D-manno-heptose-7-phosphate kinase
MIITQTPLRVSFFGGGTDYPEHFSSHGGSTLGASIDKYTYITVNRLPSLFDHRIRVSYSRTELCPHVDEIQHPSVRECLRFVGIEDGIEIGVISDIPARTGLGSSSSFTVGLLHALHAFKGELVPPQQLAREAVHVEREMIRDRVGLQDQYTSALGGLLRLGFAGEREVDVRRVPLPPGRLAALQARLMLVYSGIQRHASAVLEQQLRRTESGVITPILGKLAGLVDEAVGILTVAQRPLAAFGELLHEAWTLKRQVSDAISTPFIDEAYDRARATGAIGGKLLGAGGGGFLLLYVEPDRQEAVRAALSDLHAVPFEFEQQGSRLIFFRP